VAAESSCFFSWRRELCHEAGVWRRRFRVRYHGRRRDMIERGLVFGFWVLAFVLLRFG